MEKIIKNAIRCNLCGDVIESKHRHDFVTCKCGSCSVDGGTDYLRRGFTNTRDDFTDLSEVIEVSEDSVKWPRPVPKRTGIRAIVLLQICRLAEQHDLSKVILFGSRARGDFQERSDIDLAVTGGNAAAFALDVEEETDTLLKYDVVDLSSRVQPELLESIAKDGVTIYEKI